MFCYIVSILKNDYQSMSVLINLQNEHLHQQFLHFCRTFQHLSVLFLQSGLFIYSRRSHQIAYKSCSSSWFLKTKSSDEQTVCYLSNSNNRHIWQRAGKHCGASTQQLKYQVFPSDVGEDQNRAKPRVNTAVKFIRWFITRLQIHANVSSYLLNIKNHIYDIN